MQKQADKLESMLYWNGSLRLFIEGYMDIAMATCLNLNLLEWDTDVAVNIASNLMTIFFFVIILVFPIAFLIYVSCKRQKWKDEAFAERHGTILDGVDLERKET